MDQRPKLKSFPEENTEKNLRDAGFGNDFLDVTPKAIQRKKELTYWVHENVKHLCIKGHRQESEETASGVGENVCRSYLTRD